jgi:hypothetical protein
MTMTTMTSGVVMPQSFIQADPQAFMTDDDVSLYCGRKVKKKKEKREKIQKNYEICRHSS